MPESDFNVIGDLKVLGKRLNKIYCKKFRTSPWDPKENLPPEYARIYKIVNFKRTKKLALANIDEAFETEDIEEYAFPGAYVTLHVKNVPLHLCGNFKSKI